jgi:UDP-hydrolysing UDP-N-acetyl-D-glucosamine 2-epimerase
MKHIGVITTSRADFGIYMPILRLLQHAPNYTLYIFAAGMHTAPHFGETWRLIEDNGFEVTECLAPVLADDSPKGIAQSMVQIAESFTTIWQRYPQLDLVFVLGDRYEMFAAAQTLLPYNIKIAHIHGGETTLGALDNRYRNAITAMADFHFTSHPAHSKRVRQITAQDEHIYTVGAPGLDNIRQALELKHEDFEAKFHFNLKQDFILTTLHPETALNSGSSIAHHKHLEDANYQLVTATVEALLAQPMPILCTLPNADAESQQIRKTLLDFASQYPDKIRCYENLGQAGYLTAMKACTIMVGNTSSGIIEAASFRKPVVNVGRRQEGRTAGKNVVHTPAETKAIIAAINTALQLDLHALRNPYGSGYAAKNIMAILDSLPI